MEQDKSSPNSPQEALNAVANDTICVNIIILLNIAQCCVVCICACREKEKWHNGLVCFFVNGLRQMLIKTGFPSRDKAAVCGLKS